MEKIYEITVLWPSGESHGLGGFSEAQKDAMVNFLWVSGADDIRVRCTCNECETCCDRAAFEEC
jgi:hypothetical protein